MRYSVLLFTLLFSLPAFSQADKACHESYDKMYADGELTLSLFLGYSDNEDYVDDVISKANYVETITTNCDEETLVTELCGFKRDPDDADIFTKTITRANGKTDNIKLRITSSAVTSSNHVNTGTNKNSQYKKSAQTEAKFLKALQTDDVVIYNGHARRGTGPGFRPMGNADWVKAVALKSSLQKMVHALKTAKKTPAIIGMITCEGESHYGKALQDAAPNSGLLLTRQTTSFSDSDIIVQNSIENILQKKCAPAFRKSIQNSVRDIYNSPLDGTDNYKDKLPEIYNFFEVNKKKFLPPRGAILTLINGQYEELSDRDREAAKERSRTKPAQTDNPR